MYPNLNHVKNVINIVINHVMNTKVNNREFLTSSPGVLCSVSFLRLGVRKLPVADLTTTPGAVVKSSPKGKVT